MGWTPVALSSDLPRARAFRTFLEGRDVVVWRAGSGMASVWDNRCPHRGMRLSYGFVRGDRLTCIYHGWQYGTDGICQLIPAHPDLTPPETLCATAFVSVEESGLVWAAASEREEEPSIGVTDAEPVRSLTFDRDLATVGEIFSNSQFPMTEDWRRDEGEFQAAGGTSQLVLRKGKSGDRERVLIAALQPLPGNRTAAHILTSPAVTPKLKIELSRWLEQRRRFAESSAAVVTSRPKTSEAAGG